jgi:ribonuclease T2
VRLIRLGAALLAALACGPVLAQGFQNPLRPRGADTPCVLDKCVNGSAAGSAATRDGPGQTGYRRPGPVAPGGFDFYVLSLSWSPGFCDTGGSAKAPDQCAEGANLGFVVHGLWPQNQHGYPSDCDATSRAPSRMALEAARGVYPDLGLARYEWRKHGTCTGLSPADYFALVKQARDAVRIPDALQSPREPQSFAPLEIARAFTAANAGLRPDMMAVTCRQDELQEVRICFTKDLRGFVTCPEVSRASCRTRQISVLPVQ